MMAVVAVVAVVAAVVAQVLVMGKDLAVGCLGKWVMTHLGSMFQCFEENWIGKKREGEGKSRERIVIGGEEATAEEVQPWNLDRLKKEMGLNRLLVCVYLGILSVRLGFGYG